MLAELPISRLSYVGGLSPSGAPSWLRLSWSLWRRRCVMILLSNAALLERGLVQPARRVPCEGRRRGGEQR